MGAGDEPFQVPIVAVNTPWVLLVTVGGAEFTGAAPATDPVEVDVAVLLPPELEAVTKTRMREPASLACKV